MATQEECREALGRLAGRLAAGGGGTRPQLDRTLSCHVPDLDVTFHGRMHDGAIDGISIDPAPRAQIRLTTTSDDLVALTDGQLDFPQAWASGRVRIEASVMDLLKLRSLR
jgi:predicted lipid carrier protein YhbT